MPIVSYTSRLRLGLPIKVPYDTYIANRSDVINYAVVKGPGEAVPGGATMIRHSCMCGTERCLGGARNL